MKRPDDLTIEDIEKAIGSKAETWEGSCYAIACRIVEKKLVDGRAAYGHYLGFVSAHGFWKDKKHLAFQRHGWVELEDGRIFDPTRWSFEHKPPYIYIEQDGTYTCQLCQCVEEEHEEGGPGCDDFMPWHSDYDEGGNIWRKMNEAPPPDFDSSEKIVRLGLTVEPWLFCMRLFHIPPEENKGRKPRTLILSMNQIFWLANLSLDTIGPYAPEIYKALDEVHESCLIPIDNWFRVMGKDTVKKEKSR